MKRGKLLFCAAGIACLMLCAVLLHSFDGKYSDTDKVSEESISVTQDAERGGMENSQTEDAENEIVVYVSGAVKKPGVFTVPEGTRVYQLLERAGGFAEEADRSAVNLAAKVKDGTQITFPSCVETAQKGYRSGNRRSSRRGAKNAPSEKDSGGKVNVNSASQEELETLNGIGPKMAERIIDYRRRNGNFARLEDLLLVKGIGPKKYEKIKDSLTLGE